MLRRLTPAFHEKVWGDYKLEPWFPNSEKKIGEVWFDAAGDSPLLIKFIFTSEKLSVQVHPGDEYAQRHHASRGKTEMWHILAAKPGAKIAAGFRESLSPGDLREAARTGEIEQLLAWHDARPGETFFIPAGTVHAIGEGLVLCEIQQRSNVTYRLYDYGRPRELHLDRAVEVSRLEPHAGASMMQGDTLVHCDYFVTRRIQVKGSAEIPAISNSGFLVVLEGSGQIESCALRTGEVWELGDEASNFRIHGHLTLLHTNSR
jgi:mannose-6-phosphate isomerase